VQKQIVELLLELQARHGFGCLFISHDLKVVRALSHRVLVMRNGKMLECQDAGALFANPQHEYTQLLLKAAFADYASAYAQAHPELKLLPSLPL